MHISIISDTHNEQEKLGALSGEVLIHCGDMFTLWGTADDDIERLDAWFGRQDFELILCTGGNHDFPLENRTADGSRQLENAIYLEDASYVHHGVKFYGSPWTPELRGHAFFQDSDQLKETWSRVPADIDVLITHTPPAGILDVSSRGLDLGCVHLAVELQRISPKLHCFGHVHASSGALARDGIQFINAAMVNSQFELVRRPYEYVL